MRLIGLIRNHKNQVMGLLHGPELPDQSVRVAGRTWRFDFDRQFGPLWIGANGRELKGQNPPKAVWRAFEEWLKTHSNV
jgi:hypothetical protein